MRTFVQADGFQHYATAELAKKWASVGAQVTIVAGAGRWGGQALRCNRGSNGGIYTMLKGAFASLGAAVAAKQAAPSGSTEIILLRFLDANAGEQCSLRVNQSGTVIVSRNGTTLASSSSPITFGVFHHFSFYAKIHDSAGEYAVRVDGASVAGISDATGVNTRGQTNNSASGVGLKQGGINNGTGDLDFSDFVVFDIDAGAADVIPDCKVETLYPNGAGSLDDFTPSAGSNYQTVDETLVNSSDYNTSTAQDQIDVFAMTDLATASGTPLGIQWCAYAWKTDAGGEGIKPYREASDTTVSPSETTQALTSDPLFYTAAWPTDQRSGGATAWTIGHVNSLAGAGYQSKAL